LSDILKIIYREPIAVAQKITEDEVLNAIKKVSPDKAPGPDVSLINYLKSAERRLLLYFNGYSQSA
jgi:hypothetical protein